MPANSYFNNSLVNGDAFSESDVEAIEQGFYDVEQDINAHLADTTDAHDASAVSYVNTTSGLTATDAQAAIDEVDANLDAHLVDTTDAHDASAVSYVNTTSGLTATDVQAAIDEVEGRVDTLEGDGGLATHIADTTTHGTTGNIVGTSDTQTLTAKTIVVASNTVTTAASGNLTSTELNAALAELQGDVDTRATSSALTTHEADTSTHGVTGDILGTEDIGVTVQAYDADTAKLDAIQSWTGHQTFKEVSDTVYAISGTTPAIDPANGCVQTWTLTGNSTPTSNMTDGQIVELHIDDGTAYTITWTSLVGEWIGGSAPTLDATNTTIVILEKVGSTVIGRDGGVAS